MDALTAPATETWQQRLARRIWAQRYRLATALVGGLVAIVCRRYLPVAWQGVCAMFALVLKTAGLG